MMKNTETRREQADEILLDTMKRIQQDLAKEETLPPPGIMEMVARELAMLAEAISHTGA